MWGVGTVVALALLAGPDAGAASTAATSPLGGVLKLAAGSCSGGAPTGSYLRMVLPSGTVAGPFLSNGDSTCADQSYTPFAPGTDGGLLLGAYQPEPSPGFDGSGNSLAGRIIKPVRFFGVDFAVSTNPVDPQTGGRAAAPEVDAAPDGTLTGDLASFAVSWNRQEFNQGSPKPDGSTPGNTTLPHGTLDATTGAFTLEWASQVVGGPFDHFTGVWHLEGTLAAPGTTTAGSAASDAGEAAAPTAPGADAVTVGDSSAAASPADTASVAAAPPAADGGAVAAVAPSAPAASHGAAAAVSTTTPAKHGRSAGWLVVAAALVGLVGVGAFRARDRVTRATRAG